MAINYNGVSVVNLDASRQDIERIPRDLSDRDYQCAYQRDNGKVDLDWDDDHVLPPKVYPDIAHLFRRMTAVTLGTVAVVDQELVLDIGCGRAVDAIELAMKGGRCSGLEPSGKMISHARQHIAQNGTVVNLAHTMDPARIIEKPLGQGGLPRIDMGDDANISNLLQWGLLSHVKLDDPTGGTRNDLNTKAAMLTRSKGCINIEASFYGSFRAPAEDRTRLLRKGR